MNPKKSFRINTNVKKFGTDEEIAEITDLPAAQVAEFREIFRLIDIDDSNTLSLDELKQLLENLHMETSLMEDDFFLDLVKQVRKAKPRMPAPTPGGRRSAVQSNQFQEVSFDELMSVLTTRPRMERYTKTEIAKYFSILAGKTSEPGKIDFEVLKSAIRNGDGGMDPSDAEELMTMMHNIPGGEVDYMEMIDLFLGSSRL